MTPVGAQGCAHGVGAGCHECYLAALARIEKLEATLEKITREMSAVAVHRIARAALEGDA